MVKSCCEKVFGSGFQEVFQVIRGHPEKNMVVFGRAR